MKSLGGTAVGVAGLVFVGSAVVLGATVLGAVRVEEVLISSEPKTPPEQAAPQSESENPDLPSRVAEDSQGPLRGIVYPQVTNNEILDAVNQDLFQPDRTPPLGRYLLPSERPAPLQDSRDNRRRREPNLRIVGTAIAGDLAIVLVQLEDSIPFVVLLGEEVDGFMVAAVDEESVMLTGNGDEFTFAVVEPQRGGQSGGRDRNARDNASAREAAALHERVQQMLQGMGRGQMRGGVTLEGMPIRIQIPGGGETPTGGGRTGGGGGVDLP